MLEDGADGRWHPGLPPGRGGKLLLSTTEPCHWVQILALLGPGRVSLRPVTSPLAPHFSHRKTGWRADLAASAQGPGLKEVEVVGGH